MRRLKPDFFLEFPEHRLLGRFSAIDTALRKLPSVLSNPFTPEDLVFQIAQNNPYVGAIAVTIDHVSHPIRLYFPIFSQKPEDGEVRYVTPCQNWD